MISPVKVYGAKVRMRVAGELQSGGSSIWTTNRLVYCVLVLDGPNLSQIIGRGSWFTTRGFNYRVLVAAPPGVRA